MKENLGGATVKLLEEDIEAIDKLNINQRVFWNPYDIKQVSNNLKNNSQITKDMFPVVCTSSMK